MTLIEAVKTGRPFRRASWNDWHELNEDGELCMVGATRFSYILKKEDLLADDYVIDEPGVRVTYTSFWDAHKKALFKFHSRSVTRWGQGMTDYEHNEIVSNLCSELGLDDHFPSKLKESDSAGV